MKYKVGDKVTIRKDLKVYGCESVTSAMMAHRGQQATIKDVIPNSYKTLYKTDCTNYHWTEDMFEDSTTSTVEAIADSNFKVGDKVILNPKRVNKPGVFTIISIEISIDASLPTFYKLSDSNGKPAGEWLVESIIKVPLFKVGQIVQVKDIKNDKWFVSTMNNLDGESGMITEVTEKPCNENYYQPTKAGEDGCRYRVKILRTCNEWSISSASLQFVPTITTMEDVRSISQDNPGPRGDLGVITTAATTAEAIAQAVDNMKGPQFKIGDKVIIKNDLIPGKEYNEWDYSPEDGLGGWLFLSEMAEYKGKVATVTGFGDGGDVNYLRLDIDGGRYSWIINAVLHYTPGSDYDLDKQIINQQKTIKQNENRLQESDPVISGGKERSGCAVCYPGSKASIGIRHLRDSTTACKR